MPKSKAVCCVVGCSNTYVNTEGKSIKFYSFPGRPHENGRKEKWISNIERFNADGTPWRPTNNSKVCSEHFITKRKNEHPAHPDYLPTVFPKSYKSWKGRSQVKKVNVKEVNLLETGATFLKTEAVANKRVGETFVQESPQEMVLGNETYDSSNTIVGNDEIELIEFTSSFSTASDPDTEAVTSTSRSGIKRRKVDDIFLQSMNDIGKRLMEKKTKDEFSVYGEFIANELRQLNNSKYRRILAITKQKINSALSEAEILKLDLDENDTL